LSTVGGAPREQAVPRERGKQLVGQEGDRSGQAVPTRFPFATPPALDDEPEGASLRESAPVARVRLAGGAEAWVALRYDAARQAFTDPRFSRAASLAPGSPSIVPSVRSPDMILNMDPPEHGRVRRLVARAFSPQVVERRRGRIQEIVDGLLDRMAGPGPPADLVAGLALPMPITVICELLGVPYEDVERVREWTARTASVDAYPIEVVQQALDEVLAFLRGLLATKRRQPREDVLTRLIEAHEQEDRLSEDELVQFAHVLIVAGYETTASQLANSVVTLFRHPDQLALLRARPELVPAAVEELLRFTRLGAAGFPRVATAWARPWRAWSCRSRCQGCCAASRRWSRAVNQRQCDSAGMRDG